MKLQVEKLVKNFGDVKALDDINLVFEEGIYGLIGPNGSGKSTLINCITTLLKQTSGKIKLNDKEVNQNSIAYQNSIGLMPQKIEGFKEFSGKRFLYYIAALKGLSKEEATNQIAQLVKKVNLEKSIDRKIKTYSGGMRQRLMFVQALLANPKILILDEPTAGLDPYERINLRNYIAEISEGKIIIIATHVMQDIESIADSIILIKEGKIIESGEPETLLHSIQKFVHETKIGIDELETFKQRYRVASISKLEDGLFIRYLSNEKSDNDTIIPNLEEVYLYYLT